MQKKRPIRHFRILFVSILLSGCGITVPNLRPCAVAGKIEHGGICAETLSDKKTTKSFREMIELLEGRGSEGAAVIFSPEDWGKIKTFVEQACRKLGNGVCNKEATDKIEAGAKRVDLLILR